MEKGPILLGVLLGIFLVRLYDYTLTSYYINRVDQSMTIIDHTDPPFKISSTRPRSTSPEPSYLVAGRAYECGYPLNVTTWSFNGTLSSSVKGSRTRNPSSYSLKFDSFATLLNSSNTKKYVSRPFSAGGYNWKLIVYPKGNHKDGGDGFISLYVALDYSNFEDQSVWIYADLRFYVYNKKEDKYLTIQDTEVKLFNSFKRVHGFSKVISLEIFKDLKNGYLYEEDQCEFGVDVIIPKSFENCEHFTVLDKFSNPKHIWSLHNFSKLKEIYYKSDEFSIGGRNWYLQMHPSGDGERDSLSLFIVISEREKLKSYEKIYVKAYLRILDQYNSNHLQKQVENWFESGIGYGRSRFVLLADLEHPSKGLLVQDNLKMEVEFIAISSTNYFP